MSDFAPPTGPPPPRVPEGWKAVFNDQYKEWFYVNVYTKESTWEKPTIPATRPGEGPTPAGPPPSYSGGAHDQVTDSKKGPLESNNPYGHNAGETDAQLAARLQEEENHRTGHGSLPGGSRGQNDDYYGSSGASQPGAQGYQQQGHQQQSYPQQSNSSGLLPPRPEGTERSKSGGFLGKLKSKLSAPPGAGGYGHQQYGGGGYPQQHGGGYPQQGYGGYPQQGYGGYPQQGYGGYPQQGMYGQPARKTGGMGAGGAAALGVGGGLLGGMLLMDAMDDNDQGNYDGGGGDGGDYGGGDDGGGGDF